MRYRYIGTLLHIAIRSSFIMEKSVHMSNIFKVERLKLVFTFELIFLLDLQLNQLFFSLKFEIQTS